VKTVVAGAVGVKMRMSASQKKAMFVSGLSAAGMNRVPCPTAKFQMLAGMKGCFLASLLPDGVTAGFHVKSS
jgi:hypothetical protein